MNFINQSSENLKDNTWGLDLADMQLIIKYNKRVRFLLCAIDPFIKYAWVIPKKRKKKELVLLMHFKKFQTVQKEIQIKYGLIKVLNFIDNKTEMCSTCNQGKSVVAE